MDIFLIQIRYIDTNERLRTETLKEKDKILSFRETAKTFLDLESQIQQNLEKLDNRQSILDKKLIIMRGGPKASHQSSKIMHAKLPPFKKDIKKMAIFEDDFDDDNDSNDDSYHRKKSHRIRSLKRSLDDMDREYTLDLI